CAMVSRCEIVYPRSNLITGPAEYLEPLLLGALGLGRIVEAPMKVVRSTRKDRAGFARSVANSNDVIESFTGHLINRLRALLSNIYSHFGHHPNCQWVNPRRIGSSAFGLELVAGKLAQEPFGHLAP